MVKSAQAAGELMGKQRIKRRTGSNCSSMGRLFRWTRLSAIRQECDELIAIFVTILKRSKETS